MPKDLVQPEGVNAGPPVDEPRNVEQQPTGPAEPEGAQAVNEGLLSRERRHHPPGPGQEMEAGEA